MALTGCPQAGSDGIREDAHTIDAQCDLDFAALTHGEIVQLIERVGDQHRLAERFAAQFGQTERAEIVDARDAAPQAVRQRGNVALDVPVLGPDVDPHAAPDRMLIGRQCQFGRTHAIAPRAERNPLENVGLAEEVGHKRRRRTFVDIAGGTHLLDVALIHHDDAIGHRQRLFLVVRDHDGGHTKPALQLPDLAAQPLAHLGIERRQGLIQQQQAGRRGQCPRERDALLLATGHLARILGCRHPKDRRGSAAPARAPRFLRAPCAG